jgi:hypoxanthine-guanine phosphoribosyltransferase
MAERTKESANENAIESTITILQDLQTKIDNKEYVLLEDIKATGEVKYMTSKSAQKMIPVASLSMYRRKSLANQLNHSISLKSTKYPKVLHPTNLNHPIKSNLTIHITS